MTLKSTMQGARIWLPNIEGYFMSLGRLLESAEGQRNTASYDTAEFFSRRLRENERTLVTLTLRIEEALPNEVELISDLNELVFIMNKLSRDLNRIVEDSKRSTITAPSSLNDRLSAVARNGLVGRQGYRSYKKSCKLCIMTLFSSNSALLLFSALFGFPDCVCKLVTACCEQNLGQI